MPSLWARAGRQLGPAPSNQLSQLANQDVEEWQRLSTES